MTHPIRVRRDAALRYLQSGATQAELDRMRQWCLSRGMPDPQLAGNVVQNTWGALWSTQRYTWGGAGTTPTPQNGLFKYSLGTAYTAGGDVASYRETNMQQVGQIGSDQMFVAHEWGVLVRPTAFGTGQTALDMTELMVALTNALALEVRQGKTYEVDYGPISPAQLTQPGAFAAESAGPPPSATGTAAPQYGRGLPIVEPLELDGSVVIDANFRGNLDTVPPGSVERDGAGVDVTLVLFGEWWSIVKG